MSDRDTIPRVALRDVRLTTGGRAARLLWNITSMLLYRPSPRPFHAWRRLILRAFGARIGHGAHPYPLATIWAPWNLVMDDDSCIADHVDCYSVAEIHIGRGATVSQYSYLCAASHDFDRAGLPLVAAPITIGAGAWVAADCFIGPGVHIGDNAVVGARSTVVRSVGAGDVVAGSPPRLLRKRAAQP
jgi:putative colanic acid biosynthesis acetyltransferase WcaF